METGSLSLVTGTRISGHHEGKPRVLSNCGESCFVGDANSLTLGKFQLFPDDRQLGRD